MGNSNLSEFPDAGLDLSESDDSLIMSNNPSQRLVVKLGVGGGDESFEQRMRRVGFALEFRVKLAAHVKWMSGQFDQLNQLAVRRGAAEEEARLLKRLPIMVVEFIAVTVAFVDHE